MITELEILAGLVEHHVRFTNEGILTLMHLGDEIDTLEDQGERAKFGGGVSFLANSLLTLNEHLMEHVEACLKREAAKTGQRAPAAGSAP